MKLKSLLWSLLTIASLSLSFSACSDDDDNVVPPTPGTDDPAVSLKTSSLDVAAEGGEFTFEFTVANATDARVEAKADSEWVKDLAVKESRASFDGTVSFTVSANEGEEARKAVITVSYKGAKDASFTLNQAGKKEDPSPVGPEQNGKVTELTPELFTQWIYDHKADPKKENFLSTLPAVIDFYGPGCGEHLVPIFDRLAEAYRGKVNFFRFNFTTPDAREIKEYMGVKMCPTIGFMQRGAAPIMAGDEESNAITSDEIMMSKIEKYLGITLDTPTPGKAPEVTVTGAYTESSNKLSFSTQCVSKNAAEGFVIFYDTEFIEAELLVSGKTIEEYFAAHESEFQVMKAQELAAFNDKGIEAQLPYEGKSMTFVVAARNEAATVVKSAAANKEGETPVPPTPAPGEGVEEMPAFTEGAASDVQVTVALGDGATGKGKDKQFYFVVNCLSKDASAVSCGVWPYGEVEAALNAGSLADFMGKADGIYVFDAGDIKGVNIGGAAFDQLDLTPSTSYSLLVDVKNKKDGRVIKHTKVTTAATDEGGEVPGEGNVIAMNDAMFKQLIWDYTASPEFSYKGNGHVFLDFGAEWCHNCKEMEPIVAELAGEFGDRVAFFSIDRDANNKANKPCFDALCKVTGHDGGIPFFVMITADGKISYTKGAQSKSRMKRFIEQALPSDPKPSIDGPEFTVSGSYDSAAKEATVKAVCSSKDAVSGKYVFLSTMMVENLLKVGNTLETLVEAMASATALTAEDVTALNGEGLSLSFAMDADAAKSFILLAQNAKGGKSAQRVDVKGK